MGTQNRINMPIDYMYISDTIWVQCLAYPEVYKHAQSLLVYFSHNLGTRTALCHTVFN